MEIQGTHADAFRPVRDRFEQNFLDGLEDGACVAVTVDGAPVVDLWAGEAGPDGAPWHAGHDRQRLVLHQDDGRRLHADARRPRPARLRRPRRRLLAEFAEKGQAGRPRPARDEPQRRPLRLRPGRPGSSTSTTAAAWPPRWPGRRPGGSRARPPATTRSRRGSCRARSWSASPACRWARSSAARSPNRSAPTSTSASTPRTTAASRS